jgi:hypothetical protein
MTRKHDDDGFEDDPWMRQFLAGQQAKEDRSRALAWGCVPLLILVLLLSLLAIFGAKAADRDPYACFGSMRYLAQRAGYSCEDLDSFCAVARSIYREAGNDEAAASRLAQERGHSPTVQRLARRMCKP